MIDGLVVVDKAAGWTSHDVVAKCRGIFGQKRVGHAGTLDPGATGVLLVGLGRVTRLLRYPGAHPKTYVGEVVLGTETSTLDDEGEVTATHDMSGASLGDVRTAAERFVGDIEQVPPMVSAVKVGGRRLHELARAGEEVEREARTVTVYSLSVSDAADPGVFTIEVTCSAGTYVRTLAADLGHALGGGAHLRKLRRTAIGRFPVAEARPVEALGPDAVLSPSEAMRGYAVVTAAPTVAESVRHGKVLEASVLGVEGEGPWAVVDVEGALLAVYETYDEARVKPAVVIASA
ncbi:MAG: tRNA pseudouridine(55) synthase TruB [Acidimicrobiia bacterium]|nr:tRNA pseudouridine(55) synthase TruB [Acidimicrobiia bacterium]